MVHVSFGLIWFYGIIKTVSYLMPNTFLYIKTVLFQTIQFKKSTQFECQKQFYFALVQFDTKTGHYQVLRLRARVDLGAVAMNVYFTFPKAPTLLEPHHQIFLCHIQVTHWRGGLTPLQRYYLPTPPLRQDMTQGQFLSGV